MARTVWLALWDLSDAGSMGTTLDYLIESCQAQSVPEAGISESGELAIPEDVELRVSL